MAAPKSITATGIIVLGQGVLDAANLKAGSDAATLIIYDGVNANGTKMWELANVANTSVGSTQLCIPYTTGIYAVLTGTASTGLITIR